MANFYSHTPAILSGLSIRRLNQLCPKISLKWNGSPVAAGEKAREFAGEGNGLEEFFEEGDRFKKGIFFNGYDEVDGIEVGSAAKAPCQIGFRVSGGMEVIA